MKTAHKLLASAALVAGLVTGSAASAAPLLFSYVPTTDTLGAFSFNVDSQPTPTSSSSNYAFFSNITNSTGQYLGFTSLSFYNGGAGGAFGNYFGAQLYSGAENMPSFLTSGTFTLLDGNNPTEAGTLTISEVAAAVPEPATWAMMVVGLGAIGFAMRRKNVTTRVQFA